MDAATAQVKAKSEDLATTNESLVDAKADLKATQEALAADTAFLADLKERCARTDAEFEERSRTRAEEIVAVGQTIQILTSDEAFDLFSKSMPTANGPSFVQLAANLKRDRMERA